jgi:cysteine desulfurase/selenocysteine lyase
VSDPAPEPTNRYDVDRVRADFPILHQEVNGHDLVYLDNGATSQKPRCVIDAISDYYLHDNSNVHRGVHTLAARATEAFENARTRAQKFLRAEDSKEIVFVRGTSEAINLVARGFAAPRLKAGDEVLITEMEHHSNIVPWQMICRETGALLRVVPIDEQGELVLDRLDELLSTKTRILALTHVSNALGTVNPLAQIIGRARDKGIVTIVDGAQAAPHIPIDVQALGCDFYAFSGHKVYGPTGIGVLYGRMPLLQEMQPYQGGGEMIRKVSFDETLYADPPHKFEAGTPNIAGAVGLATALDYVDDLGLEQIARYELALLEYATAAVEQVEGIRIIGRAREKAGILTFVIDGVHAHDVGTIMDHQGIAIRAGHHCAMPVMQKFGVAATTRASFGLYNTMQEVDALVGGLHEVRGIMGA